MVRLFSIVSLRTTITYLLAVIVFVALAGTLFARLGGGVDPAQAWMIAGIGAAGLLVLVLPLVAWTLWSWTARHVRDMARMRAGEAWAHWSYDEPAWRRATRLEARRHRSAALPIAAIVFGLAVVASALALLIPDPGLRRDALLAGALLALCVVVVYRLAAATPLFPRRRGDIYVSPLGIYRRPGGYLPLDGYNQRVRRVALVDGPAGAHLRFVVATMSNLGVTTAKSSADVVVPPGREDEARRLVARFTAEVLTPRDRKAVELEAEPARGGSNLDWIPNVTWD